MNKTWSGMLIPLSFTLITCYSDKVGGQNTDVDHMWTSFL